MKTLAGYAAAVMFALAVVAGPMSGSAEATLIVSVLPEFNGATHAAGDPYPLAAVDIGTFLYAIPAGEAIVFATLDSSFGNSVVGNTAGVDYYLDGLFVAQCKPFDTPCWGGEPIGPTPWSFVFAPASFGLLADGVAKLTAVQTNEFVIRTGVSTLRIETAPVPEPASMLLLGTGLAGLRVLGRRRRQQ